MINGADEDRAIDQYNKDLESGKIDIESHWHTRYMECKEERDNALMNWLKVDNELAEAKHGLSHSQFYSIELEAKVKSLQEKLRQVVVFST